MNTLLGVCCCLAIISAVFVALSCGDSHSRSRFIPPYFHHGAQNLKKLWFSQIRDHFTEGKKEIWHQKYYANQLYYEPGGPVFLYVGGEFQLKPEYIGGHIVEMALQNKAFIFGLEHRYYGESFPKSISKFPDSMDVLSADQALADVAYFITNVVRLPEFKFLAGARWLAFGCSYPGMLAAWLRVKYPQLVYASVASSAPVLAKTEFPEYVDVVAQVLRDTSDGCLENIQDAAKEVRTYQESGNTTYLEELFPDISEDIVEEINHALATFVQKSSQLVALTCATMTNQKLGTAIQRYSMFWKRMKRRFFEDWQTDGLGFLAWRYQTCTEFGYQTVNPSHSKYPILNYTLEEQISGTCSIFGPGFDKKRMNDGVKATNKKYGGKSPNVTRVVFTNGANDPWHTLGITSKTPPGDNYVIVIANETHCADFSSSSKHDSAALRNARKQIQTIVKKWVRQRDNGTVSIPISKTSLHTRVTEIISR